MHADGHTHVQPGHEVLNGHRLVIMCGLQHLWSYSSAPHRPESTVIEEELERGRRGGPKVSRRRSVLVNLAGAKREPGNLPSDPNSPQGPSHCPGVFSPLPQLARPILTILSSLQMWLAFQGEEDEAATHCPRREEDVLFQHNLLPGLWVRAVGMACPNELITLSTFSLFKKTIY